MRRADVDWVALVNCVIVALDGPSERGRPIVGRRAFRHNFQGNRERRVSQSAEIRGV